MSDEINDYNPELYLNCNVSPNLTDLELTQLSDEIMYIAEDILFPDIIGNPEFREAIEFNIHADNVSSVLDKIYDKTGKEQNLTFDSKKGFLNLLHGECALLKKVSEYENSIEALAKKTDYINNKVSKTDYAKDMVSYVVYIYMCVYLYLLYNYIVTLGKGDFEKAITYDIGFVSNLAYIYLFHSLQNRFFEYSDISITLGNLDSSVCSNLSIIVSCIDSINKNIPKVKDEIVKYEFKTILASEESVPNINLSACARSIIKNMHQIYDIIYVKKIFTASKSHFKETVNVINKFIEKQKKYILKSENIDAASDNSNNETMESIFEVLVKGKHNDIFKNVKNAHTYRNDLIKNKHESYDVYLKTAIITPYVKFIYDTDFDRIIKDTNFTNFFEKLQSMNIELKNIRDNYLPEYEQLKNFIYSLDMKEHTKYNTEEFINISNLNTVNDIAIVEYFLKVKLNHVQNGLFDDEYKTQSDEQISDDVNVVLTRIAKRTSHKLTIFEKYEKFIIKMQSSYFDSISLQEYEDIYERIKSFIKEKTSEYKLNDSILMRYLNVILKEDQDIPSDKHNIILMNMRLITSKILKDISISSEIKTSLLDSTNINTNKYISFLKFENKMNLLSDSDLASLDKYITSILVKIREFRKYIRTQENIFSKKFQLLSIYEQTHKNLLNGSAILLCLYFYEQIRTDSFNKTTKVALGEFGNMTGRFKDSVKQGTIKRAKSLVAKTGGNETKGEVKGEPKGEPKGEAKGEAKVKGEPKFENNEEDTTSTKQSKSIKLALILIIYGIFFTFVKSYLMKHKADLNYDRIINVINTSKFEIEVDNFSYKFKEYMQNRNNAAVCKELYYKIIEVIEVYHKCNFIKNSMRTTPFPFTEMWTNGVILIIFFAILYMTFVSVDVGKFWSNKATLEQIIKDTDKVFESGYINKKVGENKKKFEALLFEFKNSKDDSKLKSALTTYGKKIGKNSSKFMEHINTISSKEYDEKINAYKAVIDKQFEDDVITGGSTNPQNIVTELSVINSINQQNFNKQMELEASSEETETLRQYEKQYMIINNKIAYLNRDTKYVNLTLAVSILLFGSYFCVNILDNSRRYQNMLSSGGIFGGKNCL